MLGNSSKKVLIKVQLQHKHDGFLMLPFSVAFLCEAEKIFKSNIAIGEIDLNQLRMRSVN